MTLDILLVGPSGHGGEGVYVQSLYNHPPDDVRYSLSSDFHQSATGTDCTVVREVLLNKVVRRSAIPDMGFRALKIRDRFDLLHVHAHPISLSGRNGTPLVMSEGSSSAVYLGAYLGWDNARLRRAFKRSRRLYRVLGIHDRLLALDRVTKAYVFSEWARDVNISWGADPEKLEVIYPGFATPDLVDRDERELLTFLFVGGDFERKGGFEVVEAFARVVAEYPHSRLLIAGADLDTQNPDRLVHSWVPESRRARTRSLLDDLEHSGVVQRHRWVDQGRLRGEIFPRGDVFVMPTWAEGFGFTNVEATSFGMPVITSTAGPAAEIVTEGRTGWLVTPGSVDEITDRMMTFAADPNAARTMGIAARAAFEVRFERQRFREQLHHFYVRALEA